jgi:methylase of polypeptide subunit release factors
LDRSHHHAVLLALLDALKSRRYTFVTTTPASHRRVLSRPDMARARDLRGVFGWNLPFEPALLDAELLLILQEADLLEQADELVRTKVRVSSLAGDLYVHSAYPTVQDDAVFFGPDSYRFAKLIEAELQTLDCARVGTAVDVGTGGGVGAIMVKRLCPGARTIGTDVNNKALHYAAVNAQAAGTSVELRSGDTATPIGLPLDLVVANPPYIIDGKSRAYRDGGDLHGAQVAIDMVADMLPQLSPRGSMILYTGSAIVEGEDRQRSELEKLAQAHSLRLRYTSLDPDVFGEELEKEQYRDVDRIELVSAFFEQT